VWGERASDRRKDEHREKLVQMEQSNFPAVFDYEH
jgi:hypothetical protein